MPSTQVVPTANRLLGALPPKDREQLLANCEEIELIFAEVLYCPGELISHVYFPTGSYISLMTTINGGAGLEVRLIGNEGMLGISLTLGVDIEPFQALVLGAGPALRITAPLFLRELEQSPALQLELMRYLHVSMSQLAQTAACTRFHGKGTSRPLAVDDSGPGTLGPLPCYPRINGPYAGCPARRHHQSGEFSIEAKAHQLPPRRRYDS